MSDSKILPKQTAITAPPTPFQNPVPRSQLIRAPRATGYPNTAPLAQSSSRSEPACKKGFIDGKPPDGKVIFGDVQSAKLTEDSCGAFLSRFQFFFQTVRSLGKSG